MQLAIITVIIISIVTNLLGIKLRDTKQRRVLSLSLIISGTIYSIILNNMELSILKLYDIIIINVIILVIISIVLKIAIKSRIKAINMFIIISNVVIYTIIVAFVLTPEVKLINPAVITTGIFYFISSLVIPEEWY